jgi:hypothetical protein
MNTSESVAELVAQGLTTTSFVDEDAESYTPRPIGTRSENDFMRFSTMILAR